MSGSSFGNQFRITTFGESHGPGLGVIVDGVPAGLSLCEEDIQVVLDRRKPGQSKFTTARKESDKAEILSGVFEGKTTGTPIALLIRNEDHHSADYGNIAETFRPGHADRNFTEKYGFRDYRGGGRSSGRETAARCAAGAIALKILQQLGISVTAYAKSIGGIEISSFDAEEIRNNALCMPDAAAAEKASAFLAQCMAEQNSCGGVIECIVKGMPVGVGEPVFEKLDANLAKAIMSIGAVKGIEIGDGFAAASSTGLTNNDAYVLDDAGRVTKATNHSGGITGGMSDGCDIIFRAAIKPTPSISSVQKTVNLAGEPIDLSIKGRHDPVIVPRAVVVVECMTAITLVDMLFANMTSRMDRIIDFYHE